MIKKRTVSKATHRTTLTFIADPTKRPDKGRTFICEAHQMVIDYGNPGRLIIDIGAGGGVSSIAFEETQTIPQKDIQSE